MKQVGYRNRTGRKYRGFHDPWLVDEIFELSTELGTQPSFPPPHVLATRIATSETFGILPLSTQLAEKYNITALPPRRVIGVPHHCDTPVHMLTRLSTKPENRYRYLQRRQQTLYAVTPVHTYAEYVKFKSLVHDTQFRRKGIRRQYPSHEAFKLIDWDRLVISWNSEVDKQSRSETDSNKRLYYKLPSQLERHYKKMISWTSAQSTIMMGGNATALKAFQDLLASEENTTSVLPARSLPICVPTGAVDLSYNHDGQFSYHDRLFYTEIFIYLEFSRLCVSDFDAFCPRPIEEMSQSQFIQLPSENPPPFTASTRSPSPQLIRAGNSLLSSADTHTLSANILPDTEDACSMNINTNPSLSPLPSSLPPLQQAQLTLNMDSTSLGSYLTTFNASTTSTVSHTIQKPGMRCAPCCKALCSRRHTCEGRGNREFCKCAHPALRRGEKVRLSEERIAALLASQANGA